MVREFTPLKVSTTTATTSFGTNMNIIDIAKYIPLDQAIVGVKLVYAGGQSVILRGIAKASKKKKDFYNQVTFMIRLPRNGSVPPFLASCKLFHNGTLHLTGTRTLQEATLCSNILADRLRALSGALLIEVQPDPPFLLTYDNLLLSADGNYIGCSTSSDHSTFQLNGQHVVLDYLSETHPVFVARKWKDARKEVYSMDGVKIADKEVVFHVDCTRKSFDVKFGCVYSSGRLVGREIIKFTHEVDLNCTQVSDLKQAGYVVHSFVSTSEAAAAKTSIKHFEGSDFVVHMVNTYLQAPFPICRRRLHQALIEEGYYSRFDGTAVAVNIRYHYSAANMDDEERSGKCQEGLGTGCNCKDISISCFNSGKMNITGLTDFEQGLKVYEFIKRFFTKNEQRISTIEVIPQEAAMG